MTTPVLYADDYGFHHGFIWYRGHFTATGNETGITLTANGGQHGAAERVAERRVHRLRQLGQPADQERSASRPRRCGRAADNVVAVLVQSSSHDEDGVYGNSAERRPEEPARADGRHARTAVLRPVTWRLQGNQGGEQLQDPTRGPLNATGLYGTNHGWDLPGYPDRDWASVSLPDDWRAAGVPEGIGWYRTSFRLSLPQAELQPGRGAARQPAERQTERQLARVHLRQRLADRASTTTSRGPSTSSTSRPGS